jgi:hypothetical protein
MLGSKTLWAMIESLNITSNLEITTVKKTGMRKTGMRKMGMRKTGMIVTKVC